MRDIGQNNWPLTLQDRGLRGNYSWVQRGSWVESWMGCQNREACGRKEVLSLVESYSTGGNILTNDAIVAWFVNTRGRWVVGVWKLSVLFLQRFCKSGINWKENFFKKMMWSWLLSCQVLASAVKSFDVTLGNHGCYRDVFSCAVFDSR